MVWLGLCLTGTKRDPAKYSAQVDVLPGICLVVTFFYDISGPVCALLTAILVIIITGSEVALHCGKLTPRAKSMGKAKF